MKENRARSFGALSALFCSLVILGCSVELRRNDWSSYTGPGAEYFQKEELPPFESIGDPIEPWNRALGVVNHGLMIGIVDPVARVYRFITPAFLRTRISKFGTNLAS